MERSSSSLVAVAGALVAWVVIVASTRAVSQAEPLTRPPGLDDATIVAIFDQANTADIETGELAVRLAAAREVRDLGSSFAAAHTQVRQRGRDLAARLRVAPASPADDAMARAHAEAMEVLRGKRGAEFDRAFLAHEIAYHQAVIEAITGTLLPAVRHPELRALVEAVLPAFDSHLAAARELRAKLYPSR